MAEPTGNPLRDLELAIEEEGEEYKRRRLAEELQKLADRVPAVSPPHEPPAAQGAPPGGDVDDHVGGGHG
jgi:hypothetical protein